MWLVNIFDTLQFDFAEISIGIPISYCESVLTRVLQVLTLL